MSGVIRTRHDSAATAQTIETAMDIAARPSDRLRALLDQLVAGGPLSPEDASEAVVALRVYIASAKAREFSEPPLQYSIVVIGEDGALQKELAATSDLILARAAFAEAAKNNGHVVLKDGSTEIARS